MPFCAEVVQDNLLKLTSTAVEQCQGVIVLSSADYAKFNESWGDFTLQNANELLVAILGLWAVAWVYRVLIRQINQSEKDVEND